MGVTCGLTRMPDNPEIWKAAAMADQFDKMQKLPDPLPGCPNFHRIPGYKVYTCGQPTLDGIKNVLEKVTGTIYPKDGPIIWLNLRQEPDVYVNGQPICARPPNKIGEYAELGAVTRDLIKADEAEFFKVVEGRVKENGGKLKYVTISKEEKEVEVKELTTLSEAMLKAKEDFPGLVHWRVPVCNSASPLETDFDIICNTLVGSSINTPIIVNDQVGLSRATTGSVIACLFKEFQINASFEGLVETVPGVNLDLLKMDKYTMDPSKDPLWQGDRQERNPQDRRQRHQAAQGEHRRVQAVLRDHGRRGPGFPQGQDHGQHPQILLPHRVHRLHEGDGRGGQDHRDRRAEGSPDPAWWQDCHPWQPAEASQDLCRLHGGARRPERTHWHWQGRSAVGA